MIRLWRKRISGGCFAAVLLPALALAQSTTYTINTVAGNQGLGSGYSGDGAAAINAQLGQPTGVAIDKSGNLYIADQTNHVIREVTTDGNIKTIAGNHIAGYGGDGAAATSAELNDPVGIAIDSNGNIYVTDIGNDVVRKFTAGGNISTVAGSFTIFTQTGFAQGGFSGDGGVATNALLNLPFGVAVDSAGNIYLADTVNSRIRKVAASGAIITTIAGSSTSGSADTGNALQAHLNNPRGIAVSADGSVVYIADTNNNRVLKLSGGALTTVAGTGTAGFAGDGAAATNAQLFAPRGVAIDAAGNIYIADYSNQRIRMVSTSGIITTIAGTGRANYTGDGGAATSATFNFPSGVAVDASGNVFVADTQNNVIRELTPSGTSSGGGTPPSIRTSQGVIGASGFGAMSSTTAGSWIEIYGSNLAPAGDSRSWNGNDFTGINAPQQLDRTTVTIGGQAAYVAYISPGQVNAQVPSTVGTGPLPVTVSTAVGGTSAPFNINVNLLQPALLALPAFNVGGKQYVTATFTDGVTFVGPVGAFAGFTSRPAKPGETIVLYGIGFGPVSGSIPAGQIVQQINSVTNSVQFQLSGTPAPLGYYGLAPQEVGVYQFNLTVPTIAPGDAALTFTLGNTGNQQTLYTTIGN